MGYTGDKKRGYQREWMAARRALYFEGKSCAKCGSIERLELDHIDRSNKVTHAIWSWSQARRDGELAKCQILCYYCHKEKTRSELTVGHGGGRMGVSSCQCELCGPLKRENEKLRMRKMREQARLAQR